MSGGWGTTRNGRRTKQLLWRWRRNPLRRRDDVIEAWLLLAVWIVFAVGGTITGLLAASATDRAFMAQRAERTPVRAVLMADVPPSTSSFAGVRDVSLATVRWTGSDGGTHTGLTLVRTGQQAGAKVVVWTDRRARLTSEPPSATEAAVEAGLVGTAAGLAAGGIAFAAGARARRLLERRRIDRWDTEWALVGPRWGHKTG